MHTLQPSACHLAEHDYQLLFTIQTLQAVEQCWPTTDQHDIAHVFTEVIRATVTNDAMLSTCCTLVYGTSIERNC